VSDVVNCAVALDIPHGIQVPPPCRARLSIALSTDCWFGFGLITILEPDENITIPTSFGGIVSEFTKSTENCFSRLNSAESTLPDSSRTSITLKGISGDSSLSIVKSYFL